MSMRFRYETVELRTRHPFNIARATTVPVRRSVVIRAETDGGEIGLGEAAVTTAYYGETPETALSVLPEITRAVETFAGGDPTRLEALEAAVSRTVKGNYAAKAGVSAAVHDLFGKMLGLPVWKLWGLDPRAPQSSFTIAIDSVDRMRGRVREAAAFPILKIKVGSSDDQAILQMIREEAPDKRLRVDANTGWSTKQAVEALPMLEDFRVELLEQPLHPDDHEGLATLARRSRIPIVADESCRTAADIPGLVGAVGAVNIKLAKCGSLREAVRMVHVARAHGMEVMLGCMIESTLGIAAAVQLAPLVDYVDLDGAALLANDPFVGPGLGEGGRIRFNHEPGFGVRLRTELSS